MAAKSAGGACAARGVWTPHETQLHYAAEGATAELRSVLHARRRRARSLQALLGERIARSFRSAWSADPADAAGKGKSLQEAQAPLAGETVSIRPAGQAKYGLQAKSAHQSASALSPARLALCRAGA